jgi:signal transduction histidine kinase
LEQGNQAEAASIADSVISNEQKIAFHGRRADAIVKGMLQHSRSRTGQKVLTDINALADEYLRLSYLRQREINPSFSAVLDTDFDGSLEKINVVPQDISRVLLNVLNNAFYAVNEKKKEGPSGYDPKIFLSTRRSGNALHLHVRDNGNGIPRATLDKIFQPFFTTKPTGQGTGLGLSLAYDIIKAHGGDIHAETVVGQSTEFIIKLPLE